MREENLGARKRAQNAAPPVNFEEKSGRSARHEGDVRRNSDDLSYGPNLLELTSH